MNLHITQIEYNSEDYRDALKLRYRVLREPLGLTYSPQQLAAEAGDTHIVAMDGGRIIGNLVLTPLEPGMAQMRQVAVDTDCQGQGVGRALVKFAEETARQQKLHTLMLHGRVAVQPFYERLGYAACGEPFEEVTLPHIEMRKTLKKAVPHTATAALTLATCSPETVQYIEMYTAPPALQPADACESAKPDGMATRQPEPAPHVESLHAPDDIGNDASKELFGNHDKGEDVGPVG